MNLKSDNSISSRSGKTPAEFSSSIDTGQWRKDVGAFSTATRQMLESIHEELSHGLASGQAQVNIVENIDTTNSSSRPEEPASPPLASATVADECDQLLAKLKNQLANQLEQ